mmetsp:Transcript_43812/g.98846  ORF Transcript_43812/g.98846 Transcript_43812/m.98846 type:complete len:200 (+) Transcript_43812:504-1103(+)
MCALPSSSCAMASKAFFTTTAVMRLKSTMPAMPMKRKKMTAVSGAFMMIGRTMSAQLSKVIIWKRVNMESERLPKYIWTAGSVTKLSALATSSMTPTAKMKWTVPMMTKAQKSSGMHPTMPLTSIHSSWKAGIIRTALQRRARRRMRMAARRWNMCTGSPPRLAPHSSANGRIQIVSTPMIQTTKTSKRLMGRSIHTQE